jgi:NAD-dependent deacetylase
MTIVSSTDHLFILTGAGVSAESGIPTFRDVAGLWRKYRIEEVASPEAWRRDPKLVWEFYSMRRRIAASARPNAAHFAIANLQRSSGANIFLCTQNVDDLHEQAGSGNVIHMHGELFKSRCDRCSREPFHDTKAYEDYAEIPRCQCGGRIRPHICWFGETPFELDQILDALERSTVFMAVGTSGVVEPAASFASHVQHRGRTIYVGPEEPANASAFSEWHLGRASQLLPRLLGSDS